MILFPPILTLIRAPERAAVAALAASSVLARNALRAAHPQLACEPTGDPRDRAIRRLLRRLDLLDDAVDAYGLADDNWLPPDDNLF